MNTVDKIKEACRKANPDKQGDVFTLSDVLLAIRKLDLETLYPEEKYPNVKVVGMVVGRWNLKDNNLENQSQETISFIYELLK